MTDVPGLCVPEPVAEVVRRWDPDYVAALATVPPPTSRTVALFGANAADTGPLGRQLRRITPGITIVPSPLEALVTVVVLNAQAIAGRRELAAIAELRKTGTHLIFVLADAEVSGEQQEIPARNRTLLHDCFRDAGPILAVAPHLACLADADGVDPGRAALARDLSGVAQLHAAIIGALPADPTPAHIEHRRRATRVMLLRTRRRILDERQRLGVDTGTMDALHLERNRLTARRDGGRAEALGAVRTQFQLARVELLHAIGTRIRTIQVTAQAELDHMPIDAVRLFPQHCNELVAAATADIERDIAARMTELITRIDPSTSDLSTPATRTPVAADIDDGPPARRAGVEDRIAIVVGASAGVGLGRLAVMPLSLVPAADIASVPAALLLGGGVAWWMTRSRYRLAERNHMRRWVGDTLVEVRSRLEQHVTAALLEIESMVVEHVARACATVVAEVERRLADVELRIRRAAAHHSGRLAACERDLATLGDIDDEPIA